VTYLSIGFLGSLMEDPLFPWVGCWNFVEKIDQLGIKNYFSLSIPLVWQLRIDHSLFWDKYQSLFRKSSLSTSSLVLKEAYCRKSFSRLKRSCTRFDGAFERVCVVARRRKDETGWNRQELMIKLWNSPGKIWTSIVRTGWGYEALPIMCYPGS